jgi:hypothetical protein
MQGARWHYPIRLRAARIVLSLIGRLPLLKLGNTYFPNPVNGHELYYPIDLQQKPAALYAFLPETNQLSSRRFC